jgi:hypothetical protein
LSCFLTDGERFSTPHVLGDDRWLPQHDALALDEDEDVSGSEVDPDIDGSP